MSFSAGDAGINLLKSVTDTVNLILSGKVDQNVCPVLFLAYLTALNKYSGGIRPIAVGNVIRRVAGKISSRANIQELGEKFCPTQVGFGTKGGCEAAVHAVRTFATSQDSVKVLFKGDYKNAFNSIRRDVILQKARSEVPQVYGYIYHCYAETSDLFYNENVIASESGVQQGDPMGPALFSLGIHDLACSLKSTLNVWYLDDVTLGGDGCTVLDDIKVLCKESGKIGLELNPSKCELIVINPK